MKAKGYMKSPYFLNMFLAQAVNWERFRNKEMNKWIIKLHTWTLKG